MAVEMLVERYQRVIFRLALSILEDPADAEEATQDSFVAALMGLASYQGRAAFKTWLFAIALNRCRGRLRARQRRERLGRILSLLFRESGSSQAYPEEQVMRSEREREVRRAVNALD